MGGGGAHYGAGAHGYPNGGRLPGPKGYMGPWGDFGGPVQKGIIQYARSSNSQRPTAGMLRSLIYNGAARTSHYWFYWVPPAIGAYYLYTTLKAKNEWYNSKEGHAYLAKIDAAEAEKAKQAREHKKKG